ETCMLKDVRPQLQTGLQELAQLTQGTLENVRTLALQLRPGVLDDLGLDAALRWLAEDFRQRLQLPVELHIDGLEGTLRERQYPALYATTLFRIAQECLTNAARYAQAQKVSITFKQDVQSISLHVSDDGCGYDPTKRSSGLGIIGMRERAALLGGKLVISSRPGEGTSVEAILPLSIPRKEDAVYAS
ncbi:MAG: sensor histidine kinase, partial [Chloroflexi bacterium]